MHMWTAVLVADFMDHSRVQIPLDPASYPVWAATVYLPPDTVFQYKFIRKESNGNVRHVSLYKCTKEY